MNKSKRDRLLAFLDELIGEELKQKDEWVPCPFCGSRPHDAGSYIECLECGTSGPDVKEDWNTRVEIDQ